MTTRNFFQPAEWEIIRQTPFWLWQMLCGESAPDAARATADYLLAEIGEPRFFPPLARVVFRSALLDNPAPFQVQPAPDAWRQAFAALKKRATPSEAAQFQMSLAFVGRNLIQKFDGKIGGRDTQHLPFDQIAYFRLEQLWRELGFDSYENGLCASGGGCSLSLWSDIQLAPMHVWLLMSLHDGAISADETEILKNPIFELFPPYSYYLLDDTQHNVNGYYGSVTAPHADSLGYLKRAGGIADTYFPAENAQIFKMSLLMLARDVAAANPAKQIAESAFVVLTKISDALDLHRPIKKIVPENVAPIVKTPVEPVKQPSLQEKFAPIWETAVEKIEKGGVQVKQNLQEFYDKNFDKKPPASTQSPELRDQQQIMTNEAEKPPAEIANVEPNQPSAPVEVVFSPLGENVEVQLPPAQNPPLPPVSEVLAAENVEKPADVEKTDELKETATDELKPETIELPKNAAPVTTMPEIDLAEIEREVAESLPDSLDSFAEYKKTIAAVNGDLRNLLEISDELSMSNAAALVKDMIRRVEDNSFSIAVVGEFKRGKSTFINALLGKDILPSDILPCSATLNRVTYGIKPHVLIKFKDGREEQVDIDKLPDYVTKLTDESETLAATVKEAIVTYPIPYCQNNVEIIDTPGLNDDANMTDVTLSVLPHVDAAILVIMANSPFSEYERAFLEDKLLTSDLGRVIFLVTAIDRLNNPEKDADRVVKAIRDRIRKHVMKRAAEQFGADSEEYEVYLRKIGEPRVFPVSPYQALQAKTNGDQKLMDLSRFVAFENALEKFLSEERGAVFLQVPINRLLSASYDVMSAFKIREGALQMQSGDFDAAYNKTLQEIETLRARKDSEMRKVDDAARTVENDIKPLILALDDNIRQAATEILDTAEISESDIATKESTEQLILHINGKIQTAIQSASKTQLEKIQMQVQRGITVEAMRWGDFSEAMTTMTHGIENRFGAAQNTQAEGVVTQGAGIIATIMGFGGAYTGYQVAGWKGVATGGAASIGVGIGTVIALGVVAGTVLALPVLIVGTLLALPAGSWLTKKIFGGEKVKTFRESFKKQFLENLEQQLASGSVEAKIIAEIDNAFDDLKDKIHTEVEATLSDTEKTLVELRSKRERDEILSETERKQLFKMRRETLKIQKRAEKLNDLLLQVMAG